MPNITISTGWTAIGGVAFTAPAPYPTYERHGSLATVLIVAEASIWGDASATQVECELREDSTSLMLMRRYYNESKGHTFNFQAVRRVSLANTLNYYVYARAAAGTASFGVGQAATVMAVRL